MNDLAITALLIAALFLILASGVWIGHDLVARSRVTSKTISVAISASRARKS